jgi:hypothetical protein
MVVHFQIISCKTPQNKRPAVVHVTHHALHSTHFFWCRNICRRGCDDAAACRAADLFPPGGCSGASCHNGDKRTAPACMRPILYESVGWAQRWSDPQVQSLCLRRAHSDPHHPPVSYIHFMAQETSDTKVRDTEFYTFFFSGLECVNR